MVDGVVDITSMLDREDGTAFDSESVLFTAFDNGSVFAYDPGTINDRRKMLDVDGKAMTLQKVLSLPIQSASHSIQRGQAKQSVADAVEEMLFQPANNGGMTTSMRGVVAQMCMAIVDTKSYHEKVFTERDGRIVYDKLAWRPPATCTVQRDPQTAAFRGFRQMPIRLEATDEVVIPSHRAFVYIHGTDRDPLNGKSDLEITHWCYQTKQKLRFLWYQFLEGQSLPKTIVRARSQAVATAAAKKLVGLRQGGLVGITDDISTDVLESSGKGADQFKAAMQWLDAEASGSVLAGFTDLGAAAAAGIGSFALSKDQTDFFLMSEQAKSREMEDHINQFLIPDLVQYNFGPKEKVPEFKFGPISQDDAASAISLLQAVAVTESPVLPREFYAELIEKVASYLELDTKTVADGVKRHQDAAVKAAAATGNPAAERVAPVVGAINGGFNAVKQKQAQVGAV